MVYKWVISSGEGQEKASAKAGEYLQLVQDPTTKIYYAEKFQNYDVAMDVSDSKDRLVCLMFPLQRRLLILFAIECNWKIFEDIYRRIIRPFCERRSY